MNQARWLLGTFVILAILSFVWGHNPAQLRMDPASGPVHSIDVDKSCLIKGVGCSVLVGDLGVAVIQVPSVIKPLEKFTFVVNPNAPLLKNLGSVSVDFQMVGMDMGINQYPLSRQADGTFQQVIILPVCTTTRTDWVALVTLTTPTGVYVVKLPFVVNRR
ncbi:MAG: hypothetical protein B7X12_02735 [Halothiobacillus sp. 20-53-49]|nr:MAG: hypothetical protein B7X12_02735 [Halothiobacillus sp. 20-53-49]